MASRAATLVKPKPKAKSKPKAPAKGLATKSPVSKPAASAKSSTPAQASKIVTTSAKTSSAKAAAVSKTPIAKTSLAKTSLVSPAAIKPSLAKVAKPAAAPATKPSALGKPATLKIKPKASGAAESVMIGGTASFESAAPKPRRRTKGEIRTRIYWAVFNQSLRRVAVFEFDQRPEAEKRAAKLAKASGEHHFIQKIKAIVQ